MSLPRVPILRAGASQDEIIRVVQEYGEQLKRLESTSVDGWAGNQSNVTTDRAFDANSTTTAELADVLGTLIDDLINAGVIK